MRNNETGEFELVVGNKQLLSGFFIVVLLFAVAFAMGYVVGQNTQRPAKMASEGVANGTAASTVADSRPQPSTPVPVPASAQTPDSAAAQQPPADAPPQPTTQPAQGSPPPEEKSAAPPSTGTVSPAELQPGSYWQVIAVKPEVAEAMRQTLKDKGFQVSLTPATATLTRVLVGPYKDNPSLGRAKTDLETAGFQPVRFRRD
jgi:cell division protein FtsN